jgi:hypothetical protein
VYKRARRLSWYLCKSVRTTTSPVRCALLWHDQACLHPQERGERRRRRVEVAGCGTVLRRLAAILVLHKALPFVTDYLLPHQVSTVATAGTDILVHGFREKLEQFGHDPDKVALRVDAANSFNAVSRAEILERVYEHAPPAARFFQAIYGGQPYVVAGRTLLLSRQGTQHGDPLGMQLFALAIQPLILRVQSECDSDLNLGTQMMAPKLGLSQRLPRRIRYSRTTGRSIAFP